MANTAVIERDDLRTLRTNIAGFIGRKLLPPLRMAKKSNIIYPKPLSEITSATTRDGATGVITGNARKNNPVTVICTEDLSRQIIREDDIEAAGGKTEYDKGLAQAGFLEVDQKQDTKVKTALLTNSPTDITSTRLASLQAAVQALASYGRVIAGGSAAAFNTLRGDSEFKARMVNTGVAPSGTDPRNVSSAMIAQIIGAAEVFEATGPAMAIWPSNRIVLMVEVDPSINHEAFPQVGRLAEYEFKAGAGVKCEEKYDTSTNSDVIDCIGWTKAEVFNADLVKDFKVAADPTTTTTTTTTGA